MSLKTVKIIAIVSVFLSISCQKKADEKDLFAKVGRTHITRLDYDNFLKLQQAYPTQMGSVFPGQRSTPTAVVETEVIFQKSPKFGRGRLKSSLDWYWKKTYFPGQLYLRKVLSSTLGATEEEIAEYYAKNKEQFKEIVQVAQKVDSTSKDTSNIKMVDSVVYTPIDIAKKDIVERIFFQKYPAPDEYYSTKSDSGDTAAPIKIDTNLVRSRWLGFVKSDLPEFFMKKMYEETYGNPFPDSLNEWFGDGKPITPEDFDVIINWLPKSRRADYDNPQGKKYLAGWLLKWKLFAEKADKTGFSDSEEMKYIMKWAWKIQVIGDFLDNKIVPKVANNVKIDTMMCIYDHWDKQNNPGIYPDSAQLEQILDYWMINAKMTAIDKEIYKMRKKVGVKFLQSDWKDDKDIDPAVLMAQADSLLAADQSAKAEGIYKDVNKDFSFTPQGLQALIEMAKIQTENERYKGAIRYYRNYLIQSEDLSKRCNTFFMVGFIYDEYMNKPEHAEINYKWILKNAPECELADDAEFMCLHLDEPMIGVEELQAEARRQGRKVEEDVPQDKAVSSDTL